MGKINAELSPVYYSIKNPASYSHANALKYEVKKKNITTKAIGKWLSDQETHSMHRPVRRNFQRRKVVVSGIDDQWQADLADLSAISRYNKGYKYLLGCIDVFSKFSWVVPLKTKSACSVLTGMKQIHEDGRRPRKLQTDMGTEFTNARMQNYLKGEGIEYFFTQNQDIKASLIERFWRTLKGKMYRYFTHNQTKKYIDILPDIVHSYNHTLHRSIKMPPAEVKACNEEKVWMVLYGEDDVDFRGPRYKTGNYVRISKFKGKFEKGYVPNWSREIFIIRKIKNTHPVTYSLEDQNGEHLKGSFYEEELQLVNNIPEEFKIEKIIAKRVRRGKKQVLIKWLDYPETFNSWINEKEITRF